MNDAVPEMRMAARPESPSLIRVSITEVVSLTESVRGTEMFKVKFDVVEANRESRIVAMIVVGVDCPAMRVVTEDF
eukprot:232576-Amorphochlora_amoeboformis.AAC.1